MIRHRSTPHRTAPSSPDYRKRRRASYQGTPGDRKLAYRLAQYHITRDAYDLRAAIQDGLCAICNRAPGRKGLVIDHDHSTGEFRELLCGRCNVVLGLLREDAQICRAMAEYLTAWKRDTGPASV